MQIGEDHQPGWLPTILSRIVFHFSDAVFFDAFHIFWKEHMHAA